MTDTALTREQVRSIDDRAINGGGIPSLTLMENAAAAVAEQAVAMLGGDPAGRHVLVICGGGNNGGDGFAVARLLHERGGEVTVVVLKRAAEYDGDARTNLQRCQDLGITLIHPADEPAETLRNIETPGLIVDAILGTGINDTVRPKEARVIRWINHVHAKGWGVQAIEAVEHLVHDAARSLGWREGKPNDGPSLSRLLDRQRVRVLAVDIPSGLDCDTGKPLGVAVRADRTVTFIANKIGFINASAAAYTGDVVVADIGTPSYLISEVTAGESAHA